MNQSSKVMHALISDVDRTLLDTQDFIFQAFSYTLKKFNLPPVTQAYLNPMMGIPLEDCYKKIAPHLDTDKLSDTHRTFQEKNLDLAKPFPHTIKTLQTLKDAGIKIAVVTTRSNRTSLDTLELTGIKPFIDVVITMQDVSIHELKPHPKPVLLALERLKVSASEAFMMGDAKEDIEAGKRAGTKTIGVTYGSAGKNIKTVNPDYIVDEITEIFKLFS